MSLGVRSSLCYLRKNAGLLKMLSPKSYDPGQILVPLAEDLDRFGVAGVHLFTFNQVARTAQWRDRTLNELGGSP